MSTQQEKPKNRLRQRNSHSEPAGPSYTLPPKPMPQLEYIGSRIKKSTNQPVVDYMASRFIRQLGTHNLSIMDNYRYKEKILDNDNVGLNLSTEYAVDGVEWGGLYTDGAYSDIYEDEDDKTIYTLIPTGSSPPRVRQVLVDAAKSYDNKPIVFLVVSPHHTIIYIIYSGKLYTVGFGYYRELKDPDRSMNKISHHIGTTFEPRIASLYTSDYLSTNDEQSAKIVWAGHLTTDHVKNIQRFLNMATEIHYNLKEFKDEYKYALYPNTMINLNSEQVQYYGASHIQILSSNTSIEYYNCLTWAQHILNIDIDCGMGALNCYSVPEELLNKLLEAIKQNNPQEEEAVLKLIQEEASKHPGSTYRISNLIFGKGRNKKNGRKSKRITKKKSTKRNKCRTTKYSKKYKKPKSYKKTKKRKRKR